MLNLYFIESESNSFYFKLKREGDSIKFFYKYINDYKEFIIKIDFKSFDSYFKNLDDKVMVINGLVCIPDYCNYFMPSRLVQEGSVKYYLKYNGLDCVPIQPNSPNSPIEIEIVAKGMNE